MKKLLTLSAVALLATPALANTTPKQTVYVTGEVYAQTCVFDTTLNRVTLPKIKITEIDSASLTDFSIKLKDCDAKSTQSVLVAFDKNSANIADNGNLKNTNNTANTSTGVQLKIADAQGNTLNLKDGAKSDPIIQRRANANGELTFNFKAGYAKEAGVEPTTGLVGSSIPVSIEYQ